jgi:hypothetical protein
LYIVYTPVLSLQAQEIVLGLSISLFATVLDKIINALFKSGTAC